MTYTTIIGGVFNTTQTIHYSGVFSSKEFSKADLNYIFSSFKHSETFSKQEQALSSYKTERKVKKIALTNRQSIIAFCNSGNHQANNIVEYLENENVNMKPKVLINEVAIDNLMPTFVDELNVNCTPTVNSIDKLEIKVKKLDSDALLKAMAKATLKSDDPDKAMKEFPTCLANTIRHQYTNYDEGCKIIETFSDNKDVDFLKLVKKTFDALDFAFPKYQQIFAKQRKEHNNRVLKKISKIIGL